MGRLPEPGSALRAAALGSGLALIAQGVAWAAWGVDVLRYQGWMLACPLRSLTGLECPGCGMTHALVYLGRLQWAEALAANPLVPLLGAFLVAACLRRGDLRLGARMGVPLLLGAGCVWLTRVLAA